MIAILITVSRVTHHLLISQNAQFLQVIVGSLNDWEFKAINIYRSGDDDWALLIMEIKVFGLRFRHLECTVTDLNFLQDGSTIVSAAAPSQQIQDIFMSDSPRTSRTSLHLNPTT